MVKPMHHMPDPAKKIDRPLNLAINYLSYQPRTIYEMQKYIKKKGFNEDVVEQIIKILLKKNYLNDEDFTKVFIETKVRYRPKSKFALGYDLKKKGVDTAIIDKILLPYDDQNLAVKAVSPKIKHWQMLDAENFKKKMTNFLRYRGFNYDICRSTLNYFMELSNTLKEDENEN